MMKVLAVFVAVCAVACALHCTTNSDCSTLTCGSGEIGGCSDHGQCHCVHHGKRAQDNHCDQSSDCNCDHGYTATCVNHQCSCDHNGKRDQHECTTDADCAGYDCTHHSGNSTYCHHHGDAHHGHSLCDCQ